MLINVSSLLWQGILRLNHYYVLRKNYDLFIGRQIKKATITFQQIR